MIERHFIHKADITRHVEDGKNDYNLPQESDVLAYSGVPCRLVVTEGRIRADASTSLVAITTYKLLLPFNVQVTERDVVTRIVFEDGSEDKTEYTIKKILPRRSRRLNHVTAILEQDT